MKDELFDVDWRSLRSGSNIARYCINRMAEHSTFPRLVATLFESGGVGGDIEWGIHRWDEWSLKDYGLPKFEGWRCYMGPAENGTAQVWECFLTEHEMNGLLIDALRSFALGNPQESAQIQSLLERQFRA